MANVLFGWDQKVIYFNSASYKAGFQPRNALDNRLYIKNITNGITSQYVEMSFVSLIIGDRLVANATAMGGTITSIDVCPNNKWIMVVVGNVIKIRRYYPATRTIDTVDTDTDSAATYYHARFSPSGNYIAATRTHGSACRFLIFPFNKDTGIIGSALSSPATFTNSNPPTTGCHRKIAWIYKESTGVEKGIVMTHQASPYISVHALDTTTGVISNKATNPSTLPSGAVNSVDAYQDSTTTAYIVAAVEHNSAARAITYSITEPYTAFDDPFTEVTPSGGAGTGLSVKFSPSRAHVALICSSSPFAVVYPWTTGAGFGTPLSTPSTTPSARGTVTWTPDGSHVVLSGGGNTPILVYYLDTGAGNWNTVRDVWDGTNSTVSAAVFDMASTTFISANTSDNTLQFFEHNATETAAPAINLIYLALVNWTRNAQVRLQFGSDRSYPAGNYDLDTSAELIAAPVTCSRTGSNASYINSAGKIVKGVSANTPRYFYDPITLAAKGLVEEAGTTNCMHRSESFGSTDTWNVLAATVTADAVIAPVNGDPLSGGFLKEDNTLSTHFIYASPSVAGLGTEDSTWAFSLFVKANGRTQFVLYLGENSGLAHCIGAVFSLSGSGSVSSTFSVGSGAVDAAATKIELWNVGWFRITLAGRPRVGSSDTGLFVRLGLMSSGSESYTGDNTSGIYLWGAQLELGSVATSYVDTSSTSNVVRGAETLSLTGLVSDNYNITVYGDGFSQADTFSGTSRTLDPPPGATHIDRILLTSNSDTGTIAAWDTANIPQNLFDDMKNQFGLHWHYYIPNTITSKFCKITITDAGNTDGAFSVGYAFATLGSQPSINMQIGAESTIEDLSTFTRTDGGVDVVRQRKPRRKVRLNFTGLTESEMWQTFWRMVSRGTSSRILVLPEPASGLSNITRGVFGRMSQPISVTQPFIQLTGMSVDCTEDR